MFSVNREKLRPFTTCKIRARAGGGLYGHLTSGIRSRFEKATTSWSTTLVHSSATALVDGRVSLTRTATARCPCTEKEAFMQWCANAKTKHQDWTTPESVLMSVDNIISIQTIHKNTISVKVQLPYFWLTFTASLRSKLESLCTFKWKHSNMIET